MDKQTKELLKDAKAKQTKLVNYLGGLPKNSDPTKMYYKLNSEADQAIKKLPKHLRSRAALDFLGN